MGVGGRGGWVGRWGRRWGKAVGGGGGGECVVGRRRQWLYANVRSVVRGGEGWEVELCCVEGEYSSTILRKRHA